MAAVHHLECAKFRVSDVTSITMLFSFMLFYFPVQNFTEINQLLSYYQKTIFKRATVCHLEF